MMSILETKQDTTPADGLKKVVYFAFGLALLYFGIQLLRYHLLLVTFPYPLEYREGAILFTTQLMLEGENPYALQNMPVAMNVYGILYHWIVYPFATLWGSTFVVHRSVSAGFLLFSLLLFLLILRRHGVGILYGLSAVLILYASLLYRYTPLARPDGLGFFLFLLGLYVVYLGNYSTTSLLVSAGLGIAAFFTKAYFVLTIPYLAVYLFLFVSKRQSILYGVFSIIGLLLTAFAVNNIYETYFLNTFINHINAATEDLEYLRLQLGLYWYYNAGILLILLVFAALSLMDWLGWPARSLLAIPPALKEWTKRVDITDWRKPLIDYVAPLSLFCLILSFGIFYFKLGRHIGNMMTYAYQLITPFLLLYACGLSNLSPKTFRLAKTIGQYNYLIVLPGMLLSLHLLYSSATSLKDSEKWLSIKEWQRVEAVLLPYENVLNSAPLTSLLLVQNKKIYDNGQTEYFRYSQYTEDWLAWFLPSSAEVSLQWETYQESINQSVQNKDFDAVIVDSLKAGSFFGDLEQNYLLIGNIEVCMFHSAQCIELEIWEPE